MKTLLYILLLLPLITFSQEHDDVYYKPKDLKSIPPKINVDSLAGLPDSIRQQKMEELLIKTVSQVSAQTYFLQKSHQQYRVGTTLFVTGAALSTGGLLALYADPENKKGAGTTIGIGALFITLGTIIHIDSHKWIGRAGSVNLGGNSISYNF